MSAENNTGRIDAYDKVTGRAMYTDDCCPPDALFACVVHAAVANGKVLAFHLDEALNVPGVVKIVTCLDHDYPSFDTGTHPWSADPARQGIQDRKILNTRVRYFGDDIAAVVARDLPSARKAALLIKAEYDEYKPVLNVFDAMKPGAVPVHDAFPDNILEHTDFEVGDYRKAISETGLTIVEGWYEVPVVKHCQIEPSTSFAYMENGYMVVCAPTQTPHPLRRVIGQAIGIPWSKVRVIKPFLGGGFGVREDALYEPLNAYLSMAVGGRCVCLPLSREEDLINTRTRHSISFHIISHVRSDGSIAARKMEAFSNKGAYGHHGHAVVSKGGSAFEMMYQSDAVKIELYTVFTNMPVAGAMRGYGAPQVTFAMEAHTDDICRKMNVDPIAFRRKNLMKVGYKNESECLENYYDTLTQCIDKAVAETDYVNKVRNYRNQNGNFRKGIGIAAFWYNTGVWPFLLEASTCRMSLNQDGSVQLQCPDVEIGQGADTVFSQMAAAALNMPLKSIHITSFQDTDFVGFGSGAYASRQTYVCGAAIFETARLLKQKILARASRITGINMANLSVEQSQIINCISRKNVISLEAVALDSFYNLDEQELIIAETTKQVKTNALSMGCCIAEVSVDIATGQVKVLNVVNVHDCGSLINPKLAEAQAHGGVSMGIGYALYEKIKLDETGKPLNNNMLDYKIPGSMDHPNIRSYFIENPEPTSPFGVKAMGEPPTVPVAPAIRNAVLQATGVGIDKLPMDPETCFACFREGGQA